jgi:uncharacterized membrane protein
VKYDNLAEVDKLASVTKKVDAVKLVMQDNVDMALQNCVKLEAVEKVRLVYIHHGLQHTLYVYISPYYLQQAEELQQQAGVFKRSAHDLKKKMWWQNMKMKLIIAAIVIVILAIIIGVIAYMVEQNKKK